MSSPPVLPDHVKKPNEEEFKKTIEGVNASIEKLQKQFVSFCIYSTYNSNSQIGCSEGKD